jgi:hypothetical protein
MAERAAGGPAKGKAMTEATQQERIETTHASPFSMCL